MQIDEEAIESKLINVIYSNHKLNIDEEYYLFEQKVFDFVNIAASTVVRYAEEKDITEAVNTLRFINKLVEEQKFYLQTEIISISPDDDEDDDIERYRITLARIKGIFGEIVGEIFHSLKDKKQFEVIFKEFQIIKSDQSVKKIKWSGTPGEFGAIFNLLFDNGYIDIVKDKKNMARVMNEIFEIKNEKNEIVGERYLYKCFGDKEKKYNPGEIKIPNSINYHKGK